MIWIAAVLAAAVAAPGPGLGSAPKAPTSTQEPGRAVLWAVGDGADGSARPSGSRG